MRSTNSPLPNIRSSDNSRALRGRCDLTANHSPADRVSPPPTNSGRGPNATPSAMLTLRGEIKNLGNYADTHATDQMPRSNSDQSRMNSPRSSSPGGCRLAAQVAELNSLRHLRNEVLHGKTDFRTAITPAVVARVRELASLFRDK